MPASRRLPLVGALAACIALGCVTGIRATHAADGAAFVSSGDSPVSGDQASEPAVECRELLKVLEQQKAQLGRELGQIKREIGLLREELGKPGLQEVFSGIGYILGLMGVGLYVHARKTSRKI